jgi:hypothetical protein
METEARPDDCLAGLMRGVLCCHSGGGKRAPNLYTMRHIVVHTIGSGPRPVGGRHYRARGLNEVPVIPTYRIERPGINAGAASPLGAVLDAADSPVHVRYLLHFI